MAARYFPLYWHQSRPFVKGLSAEMQAAAAKDGHQGASKVLLSKVVTAAVRAGVARESLMERGWLAREAMGSESFAQWELDGGLLRDYRPELVEALRWSEPGDLELRDVLPTQGGATYHHFGPQADWLLDGTSPIEGVLALKPAGGYFRTVLVARDGRSWTDSESNSFQMLRFRLEDMAGLRFGDAVEAAVALDLADIDASLEALGDTGRAGALVLRERQVRNAAVYAQALRLLGGALAYAQAYPLDRVVDWQPDTPGKWVLKANTPGKEGPRAVSKLHGMGFRQVDQVGGEFARAEQVSRTADGGVTPHWRKGHWRNQAHGPGFSLRKLLWIRPVRVLGL